MTDQEWKDFITCPNEVLSEKFTAYLSNDVLKVAHDLKQNETYMTTEEKIEVMKAYTEGKSIQYKAVNDNDYDAWCICNPAWDWINFEYRVKPESKYRPYNDIEEMLEDIKNRLDENYGGMQHPVFSGMWLKRTDCEVEEMIAGIDYGNSFVLLGTNWLSLKSVFYQYKYLNETPFGVKE